MIDLRSVLKAEGPVGGVLELLVRWWHIEVSARPNDGIELLHLLRSTAVNSRLLWPQDEVLPIGSEVRIGSDVVIAVENQRLWKAILTDSRVVGFVVDDEARQLPEKIPLDEFLFRLIVEAAVRATRPKLRCTLIRNDEYDRIELYGPLVLEPGLVRFPALVAGPGWIGMLVGRAGVVEVATRLDPTVFLSSAEQWGRDWLQERAVSTPTGLRPALRGEERWRWEPLISRQ